MRIRNWRLSAAVAVWAVGLLLLCPGCPPKQPQPPDQATRGPAFREEMGDDGVPVRIELAEEAEEEPEASPEEVGRRLRAYRQARMAGEVPAARTRDPAFDPFEARGCPPEGTATSQAKMAKNRLKNRAVEPGSSDIDAGVTFSALRAPGHDRNRWSESKAAVIEGFVKKVAATGRESCNCKASAKSRTDTHIDITSGPGDSSSPVVVEITPIFRLLHEHNGEEDWSSTAVKQKYQGKRVRITGWLFYDDVHQTGADNTDPGDAGGEDNWRATAWEIHPVTRIEIIGD